MLKIYEFRGRDSKFEAMFTANSLEEATEKAKNLYTEEFELIK